MRLLSLAAMTCLASAGLLFAACSGSSGVSIPDTSTNTDSGGQSSGNPPRTDSGADDSGIVCEPCADDPPSPECTTTDPCKCGPYTCPDAGAGEACTWNATVNSCGPGKYCNAPGCGAGKCVPVGTLENANRNPRCGCDGNTYWNASVAALRGVSIDRNGACNGGRAKACDNFATKCAAGASCELIVGKNEDCPRNDVIDRVKGVCWVTPTQCGAVIGPTNPAVHVCGNAACPSECASIQAGTVHYASDPQCPQAH